MEKADVQTQMSKAVLTGDAPALERLIDAYELEYVDWYDVGFNLLNIALGRNQMQIATILITKGADINDLMSTPLHYAVIANQFEVVKMLLEKGAVVNARDEGGETPLYKGIDTSFKDAVNIEECHKIIYLLLEKGANMYATDNNGDSPLLCAIKGGCLEKVKMLLALCTNINYFADFLGRFEGHIPPPLHHAVRWNKLHIVDLLLDYGADVNIDSGDGRTALHIAAGASCLQIVKILINRGASINATVTSGDFEVYTPLHRAVLREKNRCEICFEMDHTNNVIEILLSNGADVHATATENGLTPLALTVGSNCKEEVAELLLKNGADPTTPNNNNETVFQMAISSGCDKIVKLILKYCPNLNNEHHADILRDILYNYTFMPSDTSIVEELLKYGFPVTKYANDGDMFCRAMELRCIAFVEELLKHGFDVNKSYRLKTGTSTMPLHFAVGKDLVLEARLLISYGADVNARNDAGETPMSVLCIEEKLSYIECGKSSTFEMVQLLLDNQANPKDKPDLLVSAIKYDHWDVVKLLLEHPSICVNWREHLLSSARNSILRTMAAQL